MSESSTHCSSFPLDSKDKHLDMKHIYSQRLRKLMFGLMICVLPSLTLANGYGFANGLTGTDHPTDLDLFLNSSKEAPLPQLMETEIDKAEEAQEYLDVATNLSQTVLGDRDIWFVEFKTKDDRTTGFKVKVMKAIEAGTSILISSKSLKR